MPAADGIPILFPNELLSLADEFEEGEPARRWIQVAKTGKFLSSVYGEFEITTADLKQMVHNFKNITPVAPTQLPVDYDHLSMNPKTPGDGRAAGWFTGPMELRNNDTELWAEVEFTPDAATAVNKKEYRFVSPSFVKDYRWKDGRKIGTTLIAAAITNHPFLEGMAAITLSHGLGEIAVDLAFPPKPAGPPAGGQPPQPGKPKGAAVEVGQRVSIKAEYLTNPALAGQPLEVTEVVGTGDDAFAKLKAATGQIVGWYRVTELDPAPAQPAQQPPGAVPAPVPGVNMSATYKLRDARGQEVDVPEADLQKFVDEQRQAAAPPALPDGSVVISATKLAEFEAANAQVTSLRTEVESLKSANADARKAQHVLALTARLDALQNQGKITRPMRDWAAKMFDDPISMTAFEEWAATCTARIVQLNTEHGVATGGDTTNEPQPGGQLLVLARARAKEEGISLRDAVSKIGIERPELTEAYHNVVRDRDKTTH
jgi:hypothetical protein